MSDVDEKVVQKNGEFGENFSDMIKKVVEKELEEESVSSADEKIEKLEPNDSLDDMNAITDFVESIAESNTADFTTVEEKEPEKATFQWTQEEKPVVESYQPVSEVGIISSLTSINGTVSSKGHVRIEGNVIGDIFAFGDVKVAGKVAGDIDGDNIELDNCKIDGDVKARGDINIGKESLINGDMYGQLIHIDGKVKGNIDAVKGAHMSGSSSVKGSLAAPTLSMSAGAEIQGKVNVSKDDND